MFIDVVIVTPREMLLAFTSAEPLVWGLRVRTNSQRPNSPHSFQHPLVPHLRTVRELAKGSRQRS